MWLAQNSIFTKKKVNKLKMNTETSEHLKLLLEEVGEAKIKKTTREQFELLVAEVTNNPIMGRGVPVFGATKAKFDQFWEATTLKLNALGPPKRNAIEWKKVWSDLKLRTKRKVSENMNSMRETGGGSFFERKLTGYEEKVDDMLSIRTSAAPKGFVFGLNSGNNNQHNTPTTVQNSATKTFPLQYYTQPSTSKQSLQQFYTTQKLKTLESTSEKIQNLGKQSTQQSTSLQFTSHQSTSQQSTSQQFISQHSTSQQCTSQQSTSQQSKSLQSISQNSLKQPATTSGIIKESPIPKRRKVSTILLLEEQVENQKILIKAVNNQNTILSQQVQNQKSLVEAVNTQNEILSKLVNILNEKFK